MSDWTHIAEALVSVKYKDWDLQVGGDPVDEGNRPYIQWVFHGCCVKSGELCEQKSRKWYLSRFMTVSEVVGTAFKAALTAEEHECRENFTWNGKRVFNPHIDVTALWRVCHHEDTRDEPAIRKD